MTTEQAIQKLRKAEQLGMLGGIEVTIPGQSATEFIINRPASITNKIAYYKQAYNPDGTHKNNPEIRIVNAGICPFDGLFLLEKEPVCGV